MKYPLGVQTFSKLSRQNYVYVDKTALIYKLVDEGFPLPSFKLLHFLSSERMPLYIRRK